ncbi:unnamed protein product [Vitrella brassicaformis CCMP3155]|uniref:Uncharacterized protein n=1 Tax=Vitrella brassicaformis (strain CCMP3155) TaxID=1169540 RepID=A0A0G4FGZ6_VITBC|nr:unnamed protein product [Vitrella brassicaformis CCMP3155]|eukprot:CEM12735.1 unnamed protein product [Vitrella brassicaformis CCMP3155]
MESSRQEGAQGRQFDPNKLAGVLFDMDGTLTLPHQIDFTKMKERLGIPPHEDVLRTLKERYGDSPDEYARAMQIIDEVEAEGAAELALQPYCRELLAALRRSRPDVKTALVTRNSRKQAAHFASMLECNGASFDAIISRDECETLSMPVKPSPAVCFHLANQWGVSPEDCMFVGDFRDDMLCGKGAGAWTCLIENHKNQEFRELADLSVDSLAALARHLQLPLAAPSSSVHVDMGEGIGGGGVAVDVCVSSGSMKAVAG